MQIQDVNIAENYSEVMKRSKTNFFYSSVFLPKAKREALRIVYAYCRMTDDIADDDSVPDETKRKNLEEWKQKLDEALAGKSNDKFFSELKTHIDSFKIPHKPFYDLIRGMEMDLNNRSYETFEDLYEYCFCVASSVGLMSIEIFGYEEPDIKKYAEYLGVALQITNIMRDVKKDYQKGRIYLPLEDLREFGYTEDDLKNCVYNAGFKELMKYEYKRARYFFSEADKYIGKKDKGKMIPARIMELIYSDLLENIKKMDYNVFNSKIKVANSRKFFRALSVFIKYKLLYNQG